MTNSADFDYAVPAAIESGAVPRGMLVASPTPLTVLHLGLRVVDLERRRIDFLVPQSDADDDPATAATHLTPTEASILRLLAAGAPTTVTRNALLRTVWNLAPRSSRTLDTHITRLRQKLEENPSAPRHVLTVYRVGYRLEFPDVEPLAVSNSEAHAS